MIALVTTQAARGHDHDLDILTAALDAADQQWQIVNWDDASIDWSQFSIAVLRSTWDYYARLGEFTAWVGRISAQTTLCNPAEIVRWNVDKRYLQEMSANSIPVMETTFVSQLNDITPELIAQDVIIKPVVSAGSNNTARHRNDAIAARALTTGLMMTSCAMSSGVMSLNWETNVVSMTGIPFALISCK